MSGFVIETVSDIDSDGYLLYTTAFSVRYIGSDIVVKSDSITVTTPIPTAASHQIIEFDGTTMFIIIDGVPDAGTGVTMTPSGLNFKDSTQPAPKGNLHSFKMWFGDNYAKYDRAKSVEAGTRLIQGLI